MNAAQWSAGIDCDAADVLSRWCADQRHHDQLSVILGRAPRIDANDVGERRAAQWAIKAERTAAWWQAHERYREVATRLGRAPRTTSTDAEEQQAGRWAACRRAEQAGTGRGRLTSYQVLALEDLPFWYWTKGREQLWHHNYLAVLKFVTKHHRMPAEARRSRPAEAKLARWVSSVRAVLRGQVRGSLTPDRIELLENIPGWSWVDSRTSAPLEEVTQRLAARQLLAKQEKQTERAQWDEQYSLYYSVAQDLGRTPVVGRARRYEVVQGTAEGQAASWAARQREIRRGTRPGSLSDAQIQLLDAAPFWYWFGPGRRR